MIYLDPKEWYFHLLDIQNFTVKVIFTNIPISITIKNELCIL